MVIIACVLQDVVAALTVAYDILVGGLLVPILGGLIWRRGTNVGAVAAMAVGTVATLATMFVLGDIYANEPIYVGLASGLVVYVVGSLLTKPDRPGGAGRMGSPQPRTGHSGNHCGRPGDRRTSRCDVGYVVLCPR